MSPECLQIATIVTRAGPGVVHVQLTGDLDDANAPALHDALTGIIADRPPPLRLALDLSQVGHFSSAAITVLLSANRTLNGALVIVAANRGVHRMLEILHLELLLGPPPPAMTPPPPT